MVINYDIEWMGMQQRGPCGADIVCVASCPNWPAIATCPVLLILIIIIITVSSEATSYTTAASSATSSPVILLARRMLLSMHVRKASDTRRKHEWRSVQATSRSRAGQRHTRHRQYIPHFPCSAGWG